MAEYRNIVIKNKASKQESEQVRLRMLVPSGLEVKSDPECKAF